jgi:hypothetical protein
MSCEYMTPSATTGVLEYPPNAPPAVMGTVHATPSVETLERLIGPPTLRVFCRSAFGRLHAVAAVELLLELLLLPPQAATKRLVTMSNPTAAAHLWRRIVWGGWEFFIVSTFRLELWTANQAISQRCWTCRGDLSSAERRLFSVPPRA